MTKPIGLSNGSNYCYYITTIQLLMAVPGVQAEIAKLFEQQEQLRNDISKDLYHLTQKLPNYKPLSGYTIFFNTYHPPVQEMPKTETEASAEADQEQSLKESLNKESIKESKKEESSSSELESKKPLTWFEYITGPFYKLKQFTIYAFSEIKTFFNDYIVEPVSAFIEELLEDDEEDSLSPHHRKDNPDLKKKKSALSSSLSIAHKKSVQDILSKIEKYWLIQLLHTASTEESLEENDHFQTSWQSLKRMIADQNRLNGTGIEQEHLLILLLIQKLGLQDVFGMNTAESFIYQPLPGLQDSDPSFFPEQRSDGPMYPCLILSEFTQEDFIQLKEIVPSKIKELSADEQSLESVLSLSRKINEANYEDLKDNFVFERSETDYLSQFLKENKELLDKLTPHKLRKTDLLTSINLQPISCQEKSTIAILPEIVFNATENEILEFKPDGKDKFQDVMRTRITTSQVLETTSALSVEIGLGFDKQVTSYEINPPLTVTAPVAGSDKKKTYYLHAIAIKHGTQAGGHWTSYRASLNDQGNLAWHHLDDSRVSLVEKFSIKSGYPSQLIYIEIPEEKGDLRAAYEKFSVTSFDFTGKTDWFQRLKQSHTESLERKKAKKEFISVATQTDEIIPQGNGELTFAQKKEQIQGASRRPAGRTRSLTI